MLLAFKNIYNGNVTVKANGNPIEFNFDDNHYITVEIENLQKDLCYEITVIYDEVTALDSAKESVRYHLLRTEDDTVNKKKVFLATMEAKSIDEIIEIIKNSKCNANTKHILKDAVMHRK